VELGAGSDMTRPKHHLSSALQLANPGTRDGEDEVHSGSFVAKSDRGGLT
jgi:hypothetical protein